MPFVQISVPTGSLSKDQKTRMIEAVTEACVEAEGIPALRAQTFVHIHGVPEGGWGMGGRAVTLAMMRAAIRTA